MSTKLFDLIKNSKWDEFNTLVKKDKYLDVNIRDYTNNYLIAYAIIANNLEAVEILVKKNARLDILTEDGKNLLYIPIKYNYIKLVSLILELDKSSINIPIINVKDNFSNIALHYAVSSKNLELSKMLLEYSSNPSVKDSSGNDSLMLSVETRDINIVKLLLGYMKNINLSSINLKGESALHLSCNTNDYNTSKLLLEHNIDPNIKDSNYEKPAIFYTTNIKIIKLILNYNSNYNVNIQDYQGNSLLHYLILNNIIVEFDINLIKNINFNLYNIDNKLPIHLYLENYSKHLDSKYSKYLEIFINNSNLNFQDNLGKSSLFLLVELNLWEKYKKLLVKKKLNIFIRDKQNRSMINLVKSNKDKIELFVDLVVESYYYILNLQHNNVVWSEKWENDCTTSFSTNFSSSSSSSKKNCYLLIKKKILHLIENPNLNPNSSSQVSYPVKKYKHHINITQQEEIKMSTFTGAIIDVLFGIIYILKKFPFSCSVNNLNTSLNFELVWDGENIASPDDFTANFNSCTQNANKNFTIIPLAINLSKGSHANYLIYSKTTKELERFEPHGQSIPHGFDYNPDKLDKELNNIFLKINKKIKYISPKDFMPKIAFQQLSIIEPNSKIGDPGGFCAVWTIWYVDQRFTYPDIDRKYLIEQLLKIMKIDNISFQNLIRNYTRNITEIRDLVLNRSGLDINMWINEQYTKKQYDNIILEANSMIAKLLHN